MMGSKAIMVVCAAPPIALAGRKDTRRSARNGFEVRLRRTNQTIAFRHDQNDAMTVAAEFHDRYIAPNN